MRISDLTESSVPQNVENLVKALVMSSMKSGVGELPTKTIQAEIKKRFNLDIPYNDLMNILTGIPFIADASSNDVRFNDEDDDQQKPEDSADLVAQMATKGAHAIKD